MTQTKRAQRAPAENARPATPSARARQRGPIRAEVLDVLDQDTVLLRPGRAVTEEVQRAEIAVPGYLPAAGDRVLVAWSEDGCFVLGVLGEARRRLELGGLVTVSERGVELRAPAGDLTLSAPGRVVLRAEEVEAEAARVITRAGEIVTEAGRIEVHAQRIVEQAGDLYQHIEGLAEQSAGRVRTVVEGVYQLSAGRTTLASDEETVIDGSRILLG
jgi:hypothetical protein